MMSPNLFECRERIPIAGPVGIHACEKRLSNKRRLDLSVTYQQSIYIFELKIDSPQKTIEQIIEKTFHVKGAGAYGNHQVTLVGLQINFAYMDVIPITLIL